MILLEAENSSSISANPQPLQMIFCQSSDAYVTKAIRFFVAPKFLPVVHGQVTIAANPESGVAGCEHHHSDISPESIFRRKYPHNTRLEAHKTVSIRPAPQDSIRAH